MRYASLGDSNFNKELDCRANFSFWHDQSSAICMLIICNRGVNKALEEIPD